MTDLDFAGNRWKRSTNTRGEYWLPSNLRRHKLKPTRVIDHRFMLVLCRHRAGVSDAIKAVCWRGENKRNHRWRFGKRFNLIRAVTVVAPGIRMRAWPKAKS